MGRKPEGGKGRAHPRFLGDPLAWLSMPSSGLLGARPDLGSPEDTPEL